MKILRASITGLIVLFVVAAVATATMTIKQNMTDLAINDSINPVLRNVKYKEPAKMEIEEDLFQDSLIEIAGTSTNGLFGELKKQFPGYEVALRKNLKNSELIDAIYTALSQDMPVLCLIFSGDETEDTPPWGSRLVIVAEMDIFGDKIAVSDPYGYASAYGVRDFLRAARFEPYENMDFFAKLKFALEIFTKNTVFIFEKKPG